jgi:16S rRNA (guanine966-N2)-methyltransferase
MRVVAGKARGIRLSTPKGVDIRPTSDRAREAIFNSLHSRSAIEEAEILDLFAGTGALGIEALSRGAKKATFVDKSPESLELVKENLKKSGFEKRAEIIKGDSLNWLQKSSKPWDLVLLDPPYGFENWSELLDTLFQKQLGIVVIESNREIDPGPKWHVDSIRQYGSSVVVVINPNK